MKKHPDGNITEYINTKSKECAGNNKILATIAKDNSISFIHTEAPMQSILLYPDQVAAFFNLVKASRPQEKTISAALKCHDCEKEAVWLLFDQAPYDVFFMPVCEAHFEEIREMEGEMNLDFELIANLTLEQIIEKANKHNQTWEKRYNNLMQEYSVARKLLGLKPGQKPTEAADKSLNSEIHGEKTMKPTIKECFYLKNGKCVSQEIYRKVNGMDTGMPCPFSPDALVFPTNNPSQPTCLEFTPNRALNCVDPMQAKEGSK